MATKISTEIQAKCRSDWKTGNYTKTDLRNKYNLSYPTVMKAIQNVEYGALNKEIEEIQDNINKKAMIEALQAEGIDNKLIASKLHKLLNSEDNKDIKGAIVEYLKVTGQYAPEKQEIRNNIDESRYQLRLPDNHRQATL